MTGTIQVYLTVTKVVEVEFLEYELEAQELAEIPTCGTNVKARVIHDYLGFEQEQIAFSTFGEIEVGSEYLVFLQSLSSKKWYKNQMWGHFFTPSELDQSTVRCLSKTNELKANSFPQRAIKINYENYLVFELNNMLIPADVKIKNSGESSVIMQYNQNLVLFSDFDKYLRELIRSNKPLK